MPRPRRAHPSSGTDAGALLAHARTVQIALEELASEGPIPRLFVFDFDYTLWDGWCDTHVDPPVRRVQGQMNAAVDAAGMRVRLYDDAPGILLWLSHRSDVEVAMASRTCAPSVAKQMLQAFVLQDTRPGSHEGREVSSLCMFSIPCSRTPGPEDLEHLPF